MTLSGSALFANLNIPIPAKFDRQGHSCNLYVGLGPIKHIISRYFSLGRGRTHALLARGIFVMLQKVISLVCVVGLLLVAASQRGPHDSLV